MFEYNTYVDKSHKELLATIEDEFKTLNSNAFINKKSIGNRILINIKFDTQEELETFNNKLIAKKINSYF